MNQQTIQRLWLSVPGVPFAASRIDKGFVEESTATQQARNYYFSRDYSEIKGTNPQSRAEEWGQSFILTLYSRASRLWR
ncbi:Outer membrane porin, OprD family [Pseudomonas syringae pv. coryli]|uniref:Outer membrane porin, OprD family n=2 Tax=Pseudomonas syringae group TaxID=136849 RepID=A0A0Q0AXQ0_PSESX|nr:Outer membrane porin, OprD family [Pseudomonas syringae pv. coryli]KPY84159.1 Outer membrane porin, OprD family [Pseudomonas syringae pv. spinaceae]SOP99545.1 hypothetical protein CFBP4215_02627 [Pseudomonas syringae pv. syringae]